MSSVNAVDKVKKIEKRKKRKSAFQDVWSRKLFRAHNARVGNVEINISLVYRIHIDLRRWLEKFAMSDSLQVFSVNKAIVLDMIGNYKDQTTEDFFAIAP